MWKEKFTMHLNCKSLVPENSDVYIFSECNFHQNKILFLNIHLYIFPVGTHNVKTASDCISNIVTKSFEK